MSPSEQQLPEEHARRVCIGRIRPGVGDDSYAVKSTVGQAVTVLADIFCDGHDKIAAVLQWKRCAGRKWNEVRMVSKPNDLWLATFRPEKQEPHEFRVVAWIDAFATWSDALQKKVGAEQDVASELLEGAALVQRIASNAKGIDRERLEATGALIGGDRPQAERAQLASDPALRTAVERWDPRERATESGSPHTVEVARERARYGAWYEMFPRSAGPDPARTATFREAAGALERIAKMGFDVLYLPPIHPIGRSQRKGPNNSLESSPGDPGSPWAIGAQEGGHTAVHPELGTLEDFEYFVQAAAGHGLEIALDLAFQCSPDHPWVHEHPDWFKHRPDGTIKYAENPPKKYQDIYPLDFDSEDWRGLWAGLKRVVTFWIEHGVRIFRVDNPHTKSLRFWRWMIAEVKQQYPDAVFLSEAFTRPKVMYSLAQAGFDQSYTYFTWRNTRDELTEYLTELTQTEVREFFRPNLWPNTPDILPELLQYGGRSAFMSRFVLAATLGASYGIYSGYEALRSRGVARARGVPGFGEVPDPPPRLGAIRQPRTLHHALEPHPSRESGAALRPPAALPRLRQRASAVLQQDHRGSGEHHPRGRQPRPTSLA